MIEIVALVKFNDYYAYVLNEDYTVTYEKHGELLIGSDDTQTFFDVLYYSPCGGNRTFGGNYAFGGREFDLQMKDGTTTHCYGQYWAGRYNAAAKILGIKFADLTHSTVARLRKCYVFHGGIADFVKLEKMEADFLNKNPGYELWDYREYEKYIRSLNVT